MAKQNTESCWRMERSRKRRRGKSRRSLSRKTANNLCSVGGSQHTPEFPCELCAKVLNADAEPARYHFKRQAEGGREWCNGDLSEKKTCVQQQCSSNYRSGKQQRQLPAGAENCAILFAFPLSLSISLTRTIKAAQVLQACVCTSVCVCVCLCWFVKHF